MLIQLNAKQRAICQTLLDRSGPIPAKDLAARHGISLRSVRYHLETIRTALKGTGLHVEAKPHQGIWIEGPPDRRQAVARLLTESDEAVILEPTERVDQILHHLLSRESGTSIDDLAEAMRCSKSTITRDLTLVEQRLQGFSLQLSRARGLLVVTGDERDRREAMVHDLVQQLEQERLLTRHQPGLPGAEPETTGPAPYQFLADLIRRSEERLGRTFTDESFISLVVHLAVALQRLKDGRSMVVPPRRLAELKQAPEWPTAVVMAAQIEAATGVKFPAPEIAYLVLHLSSGRAQPLAANPAPPESLAPDPKVVSLVERFLHLASERLGVALTDDDVLRDGLTWHLSGLLKRMRFKVRVTNPMMSEIRQQMGRVFGSTQEIVQLLKDDLGDLLDDEVGFLTIHLAAALERKGEPPGKRVLVVCSTGLGSAQLLAARLMRLFPNLHVVGVVSALESTDWEGRVDLVISTVPLPTLPIPNVRVSPILTAEEAERVGRAMRGGSGAQTADADIAFPSLDQLHILIAAHAQILDEEGLRKDLYRYVVHERPPLELIEPILREVGLLGITLDARTQQGLAIHLQMALPRFRAGQLVTEPELDRMKQAHRSLFQAVWRALQLIDRWHGVTIPEVEVVPILRYILQATRGDD
ncbi:MAG TPA: PRD domain-containing protein [Symbiobacteriaceae bacterium]|nr:PRD domain-containing protein [Symbiobacteriaceae bacterium]